ncbi:hypothetical protein [Pseudorhodoplanes sp.]|uniref:hypothetical protein n=1 Tax=Pseudorhodoplanes sp. TaxID=1934341 RepID=UPI002BB37FA7|nr:hypothetical protein [Pseudorhodoplanes sp.]HWV54830.1 hypothetical protein [Pseudorhodoplanes sp.]
MYPRLVATLAAALCLIAAPAGAEMDQKKLAAAQKAAADFVKLAGNSTKTGKPPRESDPAAKALLDVVLDTSAMTSPEFSDIPRITQWLANADKVGLVYMMAGTGTSNLANARNPKIGDRIGKNIAEFQNEYGRFVDFQLALSGFTLDAIRAKMASASDKERKDPKFQGGFMQVSSGIVQTVAGTISTFTAEGITDEWRRARMAQLNALAPKIAESLPKPMRDKLGEMTREIGGQLSDPQIRDSVASLADSIVK